MATVNQSYGTYTALTVTNLHSLATDVAEPIVGWQSDKIDNQSSVKAIDYEIMVEIAAVDTAPANDKAIYIYAAPCITTDGGTTWKYTDPGDPDEVLDGVEDTCSVGANHNMKLLGVMAYNHQNMLLRGVYFLSNAFGQSMPDGFQIVITNGSGMTFKNADNIVAYRAITQTVA